MFLLELKRWKINSELMFIAGKTNKSSAFNIFMEMAVLTIKMLALSQMASSTKWLKSHISTFANLHLTTMTLWFNCDVSFQTIINIWIIRKENAGGWKRISIVQGLVFKPVRYFQSWRLSSIRTTEENWGTDSWWLSRI